MEFIKYCIVGGISFVIDFIVLIVFKDYVLNFNDTYNTIFAAFLGFAVSFISNYYLGIHFVFNNKTKNNKSFIYTMAIAIIGLFLTEIGLYLGEGILEFNYRYVKIVVSGIVLIWNFWARKVFIFK